MLEARLILFPQALKLNRNVIVYCQCRSHASKHKSFDVLMSRFLSTMEVAEVAPAKASRMIRLTARDGHELDAYVAHPPAGVRGGVVIAQEMYGVNDYL